MNHHELHTPGLDNSPLCGVGSIRVGSVWLTQRRSQYRGFRDFDCEFINDTVHRLVDDNSNRSHHAAVHRV